MLVVVVLEDEVPTVEAVLAAVGDDVAVDPHVVLARRRQQEGASAAIDAGDLLVGFEHVTSMGRARPLAARSIDEMRVVAGELRGRRFEAPPGNDTRPTTDKVREAMFNALGSLDVVRDAVVVDLFAGSGALGIEALSRGAAEVVFVERDRAALRALRDNLHDLGLGDRARVVQGDALVRARDLAADLVLADPPYEFDAWPELLGRIDASVVVAEAGEALDAVEGWSVIRAKRYGRTWVTFFERINDDADPSH